MYHKFPKTLEEYWALSREERMDLFLNYGFGHRTITEDLWFRDSDEKYSDEKINKEAFGQMVLFDDE